MADVSARTGGVLSFVVGGIPIEVGGNFELQPHSFQRTSVGGLTGPAGSKREYAQPYIEGECFYKPAFKLKTLHGMEGVDVQANLDNGHSFVLFKARQVGEIALDGAEGTFTLRLEGPECKEL